MASNGGGGARSTNELSRSVLAACQVADPAAKITYVGCDPDGRTVVRVRASEASSACTLQRRVQGVMPLARVSTVENALDGSMHAEVTLPTRRDEWRTAHAAASQNKVLRLLHLAGGAMLLLGTALWATQS
jgi:hypothetical protein